MQAYKEVIHQIKGDAGPAALQLNHAASDRSPKRANETPQRLIS